MLRFIGLLVVLLALVAGFGYYRGWFHAQTSDINGQHTVTMTVDNNKLNQDKAGAQQQVQDVVNK
jgi:hypothetical protein